MQLVDALALVLKHLGVKFVFGISGANIEHLHDAIYRLGGDQLKSILAKSEYSAAFMADGLARTHNTLGVCCASSGGGMMNLAVGIAESYADKVPVLAIIGQISTNTEGGGVFQDSSGSNNSIDALSIWQHITKYTDKITQAYMFWPYLKTALQTIFAPPLGPAALLIPRNLFESEVGEIPANFDLYLSRYKSVLIPRKVDIEALVSAIKSAHHPLLIVGGTSRYTRLSDKLSRFVEYFNLKVATTIADINAFAQNHPNYLGLIGIIGHQCVHDYLQYQADLMIILGTEPSSLNIPPTAKILIKTIYVGCNSTPSPHDDLIISGDIRLIIDQSLEHLSTQTLQSSQGIKCY